VTRRRVVLTGLGIVCPIGNSVPEAWAAAVAGKPGITRITRFDPARLSSQIAGEVKGFDVAPYMDAKEARRMDQFIHYGMAAGLQAWRDCGLKVTAENAERVGLRTVIDQRTVQMVVKTLSGGSTEMPKNWNRRFKHNRDKMKTGNIFELAEVVRNLAVRNNEKGLSTGEKQMFVKAKKILASELMYAKDMNEDEAAAWLDDILSRAGTEKPAKPRAKTKAATASA